MKYKTFVILSNHEDFLLEKIQQFINILIFLRQEEKFPTSVVYYTEGLLTY